MQAPTISPKNNKSKCQLHRQKSLYRPKTVRKGKISITTTIHCKSKMNK